MSLKEKIIRDLRQAIVNREYGPGAHLTEAALCERFKVSRTPVRESLNQLEKEGFIKIIAGAGAKVVNLSLKETLDIYDILIILEGASSRLACANITGDQLQKLEEYNYLFEKAKDQKNTELLFELNSRFHWLITEATRNAYLIDMRANFRLLVDRIARLFPSIPGQCEATLLEHKHVIDALKSKNSPLAEFTMREHLEGAKRKLQEYLREKQEEW
jgi:DNA-binding GntR family transcriptional regulator